MGVVYSLYDALVSINVPDEKAKAVIDALEREMIDKLATKSDLENLRRESTAGLAHAREILSRDMVGMEQRITAALQTGMAQMETKLTLRLGGITVAMITLALALIGAVQYLR